MASVAPTPTSKNRKFAAPEARELIDYDSTLCALDPSTVIALADNLKRIAAALASPAVG